MHTYKSHLTLGLRSYYYTGFVTILPPKIGSNSVSKKGFLEEEVVLTCQAILTKKCILYNRKQGKGSSPPDFPLSLPPSLLLRAELILVAKRPFVSHLYSGGTHQLAPLTSMSPATIQMRAEDERPLG